jgi:hypothetical protein
MTTRPVVVMEVVAKPVSAAVPTPMVAAPTPVSPPTMVFVGVPLSLPVARRFTRSPGRSGCGGHATAPTITGAAPLGAA